jgi:hypothetical protein
MRRGRGTGGIAAGGGRRGGGRRAAETQEWSGTNSRSGDYARVMVWARRRRVGGGRHLCFWCVVFRLKGEVPIILGKSRPRGEWGPRKPLKGWTTMPSPRGATCMQANANARGGRVKSIHTALSHAFTHTGIAATCALATQVPRWGGRHRASLTCSETADTACDHRLAPK